MCNAPLAATAALVAALIAGTAPVRAGPAMSWSSDDVDYTQDLCMQRAQRAFAQEGWANIHPSGRPPLAVAARKGRLAGLILCIEGAIGAEHAVAIVFVAGGDGDMGSNARDRLQYYLRD